MVRSLLDLRNDFVFKAFFADEQNNGLLIEFLKSILGDEIVSAQLIGSNCWNCACEG